jgi:hypothetical protein
MIMTSFWSVERIKILPQCEEYSRNYLAKEAKKDFE